MTTKRSIPRRKGNGISGSRKNMSGLGVLQVVGAAPPAPSSTTCSSKSVKCAGGGRAGRVSLRNSAAAKSMLSSSYFLEDVEDGTYVGSIHARTIRTFREVHMFSWDVFSSLADEVVLCVFSHLNLEGLCCVSAVCRRWKRLADDDSLWNSLLYRVIPKGAGAVLVGPCHAWPTDVIAAYLHVELDDELQEHKRDAIYYNSAEGRR